MNTLAKRVRTSGRLAFSHYIRAAITSKFVRVHTHNMVALSRRTPACIQIRRTHGAMLGLAQACAYWNHLKCRTTYKGVLTDLNPCCADRGSALWLHNTCSDVDVHTGVQPSQALAFGLAPYLINKEMSSALSSDAAWEIHVTGFKGQCARPVPVRWQGTGHLVGTQDGTVGRVCVAYFWGRKLAPRWGRGDQMWPIRYHELCWLADLLHLARRISYHWASRHR